MKTLVRAACIFAILMFLFTLCWAQEAPTPLETTLCDLYEHPEQYAGKMIKVRGGSVGDLRIENMLHDSPAVKCSAYMRLVVVFPDQVRPIPFQLVRDESYKKLSEALHSKGPIHIDATYEGRFEPAFVWRNGKRIRVGQNQIEKGYGNKHQYDGRIVLRQVSDVWAERLPSR